MTIKISKENTYVRPFGVVIKLANRHVCIPKSFILNREMFHINENLELDDWFYNTYIEPLEGIEKSDSQNSAEISPGENTF
jgi:hypothetical protein